MMMRELVIEFTFVRGSGLTTVVDVTLLFNNFNIKIFIFNISQYFVHI